MKRIIFAIHGIKSEANKDNWVHKFADFGEEDSRFKDDIFVRGLYGYLLAIHSAAPTEKFDRVKKLKEILRELLNKYPGYELNIVAHSYGTELSFWAIRSSGEDGESIIRVNKLILVASVVSRHRFIPYAHTLKAGKIKEMHCYCNHADWVCRFNIFGHSGFSGFARTKHDPRFYEEPIVGLEIYNHFAKGMGHGGYLEDPKYFKEWLDIIDKA